ncbi:MAG: hypothetical protein HOI21_14575 [Bacteroidetes Order II. Incertae sedis bacterium]|jgi:hypothetical protein|nr:hypothetical protein [Bacteroidetes Order II. bacterium]
MTTVREAFAILYNKGLVMKSDRGNEKRIRYRWDLSRRVKQVTVKQLMANRKESE